MDILLGCVNVATNGAIQTAGINSTGILAQSVGGGGGFLGINTANDYRMQLGSSSSEGSNSSFDVSVDNKGIITTTGNNSAALIAQSIGGGGGSASINWKETDDQDGEASTPGEAECERPTLARTLKMVLKCW